MNSTDRSRLKAIIPARTKRGQTLAEYALVIALISVVAISALATMSGQVTSTYTTIDRQLSTAEIGGASAGSRSH
jgi:Flp pilus assembly pilin Flp